MSDSIDVRVTLDRFDFLSSEQRTQVYVQIPEVARVAYLLPAERFHGLVDRAWPEVLDVADEHYRQGWAFVHADSVMASAAVRRWLEQAENRDEVQAAYEADCARRDPVVRKLRARVAELETDLAAKAQDAEAAVAGWGRARDRIAELEEERRSTNEALDDAVQELRKQQDRFETLGALCDAADQVGIVSGGWFTVEAVRRAAAGEPLPKSDGITRRIAPPQVLRGRALLDAVTVERAEQAHRRRLGLDLPETGGAQ